MRMQASQHDCGPTALMNALRALGIDRGIDELRKLTRATATAGTSARNLVAGARRVAGVEATPFRLRGEIAMMILLASLSEGHPCILSVDSGEHWVAAVGVLGPRVLVADSADADLVLSYSAEELAARWDLYMIRLGRTR